MRHPHRREFDYGLDVYVAGGRITARIHKAGSVVAAGIGDDEPAAILNAAKQLAGVGHKEGTTDA